MKTQEQYMEDAKYGDTIGQVACWLEVWDKCLELGMKNTKSTGREDILAFIIRLAKRAKANPRKR